MLNENRDGGILIKSVAIILFLIVLIFLSAKFGKSYYAYKDLEKTMEYWARECIKKDQYDHSNIIINVMDKIRRHKLPLKEKDISIFYDRANDILSVEVEYYVDITLLNYTHRLHFNPRAIVKGE